MTDQHDAPQPNENDEPTGNGPDQDDQPADYRGTIADIIAHNNRTVQNVLGPTISNALAQNNTIHVMTPEMREQFTRSISAFQVPVSDSMRQLIAGIQMPKAHTGLMEKLRASFNPSGLSAMQQFLNSSATFKLDRVNLPAMDRSFFIDPSRFTTLADPDGKFAALAESIRLNLHDTTFTLPSLARLAETYEAGDYDTNAFESFAEAIEQNDEWREAIDAAVERFKPPLISRKLVRRVIVLGVFLSVGSVITVLCLVSPPIVACLFAGLGVGAVGAKDWTQKQLDERWPVEAEGDEPTG
ncbi:hypothetical protein [Rhodococcus sp. (in: high G+C Gram-positive bacteria)]|uniref:hypothetical protein n=1 Tax=Rhodococcus sp. TaxID=1831 RepID=UPI00258F999A|nr:hypothetical protein [Rhodococcus sp. (in: high G+C Gram-positive bacteria)]